jgi:restriction system protein
MISPFDTTTVTELTPEQFELSVKRILEASSFGLSEFRATHREIVAGIDGAYEIDITARFQALGVDFLVLAECKHHRRPIKRETVQVLHSRLHSVGAQKGILFSTCGFQKGALQFAAKHGIALVRIADEGLTYETRSLHPHSEARQRDLSPGRYVGCKIAAEGQSYLVSVLSPDDNRYLDDFLRN